MLIKLKDIIRLLFTGSIKKYHRGIKSNNFDGRRFYNEIKLKNVSSFEMIRWKLTANARPWPLVMKNEFDDIPPSQVEGEELRITWVGHVSFLIQTHGINILTDPVWSERASPFTWAGPKRVHEPGIKFENLPKIDVVLVSHNHYDHLDLETIKKLWYQHKPRIIMPLGNERIIHSYDKNVIVESYNWHNIVKISDEVEVSLEPVHHWSARGVFDRNKALWSAFVIKTPSGNTCFIGDAAYVKGHAFQAMAKKHGKFRLSLIPIGAFEPRWFMERHHMDPKEALLVHKHLNTSYSIPMHYLTFQLADDGYDEALSLFHKYAKELKADTEKFKPLKIGESWFIPKQ